MVGRLPLDSDLVARTPSEVLRLLAELLERIEQLEAENRDLKARLGLNSSNSSKPPSTDLPNRKRKPPVPKSGRKRGGQPGHRRHERPLVPPDQVDEVVECRPSHCQACAAPLAGNDVEPLRRQVAEVPPIRPHVTEYRLHTLTCQGCGGQTAGTTPPGVPAGAFGPRLSAMVGLLSGVYRLGKRPVRQLLADLFGLSISTGMVCKLQARAADLLTPAYDELRQHVHTQNVNLDETGWHEDTNRAWLWTVVAPLVTVFRVARSRGRDVVAQLLGKAFPHVATCDHWKAYGHLKRVQWCWAHLRRDFQAMIDRGGPSKPVGEALLDHSDHLFHWWHRVRDGTLARATFQTYVGWMKSAVRDDLERGTAGGCAKTAATCRALLAHEPRLWTFVRHDGVEPTNNVAERAVRHGVLWRKSSGGTDSVAGSRFVERILSVVATCRQQGRNVWDYLTDCHRAALVGQLTLTAAECRHRPTRRLIDSRERAPRGNPG
jgi:transposase